MFAEQELTPPDTVAFKDRLQKQRCAGAVCGASRRASRQFNG
jgi:hypothetical protein